MDARQRRICGVNILVFLVFLLSQDLQARDTVIRHIVRVAQLQEFVCDKNAGRASVLESVVVSFPY